MKYSCTISQRGLFTCDGSVSTAAPRRIQRCSYLFSRQYLSTHPKLRCRLGARSPSDGGCGMILNLWMLFRDLLSESPCLLHSCQAKQRTGNFTRWLGPKGDILSFPILQITREGLQCRMWMYSSRLNGTFSILVHI